jgi:predicted DNA-binding transcriptional regulator AlpA
MPEINLQSDDDFFVRLPYIKAALQCSKTKVYELIKRGLLPVPLKLGRNSLWRKRDLRALVRKIEQGKAL